MEEKEISKKQTNIHKFSASLNSDNNDFELCCTCVFWYGCNLRLSDIGSVEDVVCFTVLPSGCFNYEGHLLWCTLHFTLQKTAQGQVFSQKEERLDNRYFKLIGAL